MSYKKNQKEKAASALISIKRLAEIRRKLKLFLVWSGKRFEARYSNDFSYRSQNIPESLISTNKPSIKSKFSRSQSFSKSDEAKKLLATVSSKPLSLSRNQSSDSSQFLNKTSPFHRLYEDAAIKDSSLERFRKEFIHKEMEECTFRPTVGITNEREGSVFERLNYTNNSYKEQIYEKQREIKELKDCTFKPKINVSGRSTNNSFEKLYKDAEVQRQKINDIQLTEKNKGLDECTFAPKVMNKNPGNGNVYEKLYNNFKEIQSNIKRKQLENEIKEVAEVQFVPKLSTPKNDVLNNVPVYTRLYAEVEKRKEKAFKKIIDRERSKSATKIRKAEDPPRFEHLYKLHKEKRDFARKIFERIRNRV